MVYMTFLCENCFDNQTKLYLKFHFDKKEMFILVLQNKRVKQFPSAVRLLL